MARSTREPTPIPTGYSESTNGNSATLRWTQWPPVIAGMILIPWLIGWSIFTPLVWNSFLTADATWSSDGDPASVGDAIGFTFFWFFGFSLFCYLYLRKEQFTIGSDWFERTNGCCFLYFKTTARQDAISKVRHRTENMPAADSRSSQTIDYIEIIGALEQTLYFDCRWFKLPLRYNDLRSYEMLLADRHLARYVWDSFQTHTKTKLDRDDADHVDG